MALYIYTHSLYLSHTRTNIAAQAPGGWTEARGLEGGSDALGRLRGTVPAPQQLALPPHARRGHPAGYPLHPKSQTRTP